MKVKALLFDLDGTLLPIDTELFLGQYIQAISMFCKKYIDPKALVAALWEGTAAMIANMEQHRTNEEVFVESFTKKIGIKREDIWPVFDQFYREEFPKLKQYVTIEGQLARTIIDEAVSQGYRVVIATNPVFPADAIKERMKWIEIADMPIEWVTVYEQSHFCKPTPHYYQEICERLSLKPEECMMIGNDMQEDMVAGTIGMRTFLVTDFLKDKGEPRYHTDGIGSLAEFYQLFKEKKI